MSNSFEIIVIAIIVLAQVLITLRAFRQINIMNSFLPEGRSSLKLEEYEIPSEDILGIDPSDVVGKITYKVVPKAENEKKIEEKVEKVAPESPIIIPVNNTYLNDDFQS